jgi:phage shock protein PspC (stress-responsive transcriptional regulator)
MAAWPPGSDTGFMTNLRRPRSGRIIGGVCAAIADRFGWDPTAVRVVAVLSCLLPGPQFVAYILLWILIPEEGVSRAAG